eukprot:730493-Prorocentrum_minimum.AAC.1
MITSAFVSTAPPPHPQPSPFLLQEPPRKVLASDQRREGRGHIPADRTNAIRSSTPPKTPHPLAAFCGDLALLQPSPFAQTPPRPFDKRVRESRSRLAAAGGVGGAGGGGGGGGGGGCALPGRPLRVRLAGQGGGGAGSARPHAGAGVLGHTRELQQPRARHRARGEAAARAPASRVHGGANTLSLLRLVPAPGISSCPSSDWSPPQVYPLDKCVLCGQRSNHLILLYFTGPLVPITARMHSTPRVFPSPFLTLVEVRILFVGELNFPVVEWRNNKGLNEVSVHADMRTRRANRRSG